MHMPALTHPNAYMEIRRAILAHNETAPKKGKGCKIPEEYLDYNVFKIFEGIKKENIDPNHLTTSQGESLLSTILSQGAKPKERFKSDSCVKGSVIEKQSKAMKGSLASAYKDQQAAKGRDAGRSRAGTSTFA